jgi:F0F1-type ATP synthase assembly protein I
VDDAPHEPPSLGARDLLSLGGMLVGCVVIGMVVGLALDSWLGTSPALVFTGTMLGVVAAAVAFWTRIRSYLRR